MPVPLFDSTLVDLPTFLETWPQVNPEPGTQTGTLLYWLSWGTYRLNTPQGPIPVVDTAMQQAHPQWFHDQNSVLSFAEELGEAVASLLAPLPPPLASWVESGQWRTWMDELWTRWRAAGPPESAGQQAIARLLTHTAQLTPATWVEFAYTNDGQGRTHGLSIQRLGGAVDITWQPPEESDDGLQYWLPLTGHMRIPESLFIREVTTFRQQLRTQMNDRLQTLSAQGHLPFDQAVLGKAFLREALQPVQPGAPISPRGIIAAVQRLETHFRLNVEECLPGTHDV